LQDKDGRTIKLVGVSHGEPAQNIQVDVLQAIDDAKQVLLETDPDTVVDYVKQNIKAKDWPPMDQGLTEETNARLTKFLSAPADFLHKPNVMGKIFGYIYARGMSRSDTTLFPVRWKNLLSLEKSIKRKFTSRKLSINEIEGAESYSKTMREFALVDYDALVNAAIDCAEKSACMKNWEKTNSEIMDGNFGEGGYDEFYRRFHIYPSLGTRTLPARNAVMHKNIVNLLGNSSSTLVIVGAAHVGGPSGLLNLLNGDGFMPVQCN